ncbi:MAG TPA: hypothetical protein VL197_09040 [Nitrospirota bacterium]|nr:hypothetical protein [Nitrospirota bacterium]
MSNNNPKKNDQEHKEVAPIPSKEASKETPPDLVNPEMVPFPPELAEALKTAPPGIKQAITQMSMFAATGPMMAPVHPLLNKLSQEQITKVLDYMRDSEKDETKLHRSGRWFHFG